ncbi:MAG: putative sulfate/molybdate transporter [Syntrophomonadaceae bacterium]
MNILKRNNISGELAGSIGDLGTLLPYLIGGITIAGLDSTGVFVMFGLMYLFTAWFYRVPVPVQPMKVIGAAIIVHHLTPGEVAASGIMMGALLLIISFSGIIERIARITPQSVTFGIQAGLGVSLCLLGIKLVEKDWLLGAIILIIMLFLLNNKRLPASIVALFGGTALAFALHPELTLPVLKWGINMPHWLIPTAHDFYRGFYLGVLPQFPLTITNSVLVTAVLASQLLPETSSRVTDKNLCFTLGVGNILAAPMGGYPMCHGSGGLAAHYRFGGRTWLCITFIGLVLLFIGIFLGASGLSLLQIVPSAVLGGMLFYSGIDLIRPVKVAGNDETFCFVIVLILSVAINPAIAFVAGIPLAVLQKRGWIKI